jgi:uncharacterized protein (DUF1330 family)
MKTRYTISLTLIAGIAIGAVAVHSLHAQSKPMAYVVAENIVNDPSAYTKDFLPVVRKVIEEGGGKYLARGGKTVAMHGAVPPPRVVILQFDSLDKAQAWADSPAAKAAFAVGEKSATLHDYIVEGISQ